MPPWLALKSLIGALPDGRLTCDIYRALVVSCVLYLEGAVPPSSPACRSPPDTARGGVRAGSAHLLVGSPLQAGPGETLFAIADRFGYLPQDVVAVNPHIPQPRASSQIPAATFGSQKGPIRPPLVSSIWQTIAAVGSDGGAGRS